MTARYSAFLRAGTVGSGATLTVLQVLAGANDQMTIIEIGLGFDGSTATSPAIVDLIRQTTAGSGSSAVTPVADDPADGTGAATAIKLPTSEPTAGNILRTWDVAVNNGLLYVQWPLGREPKIGLSGRLGLRVVMPTGVSALATGFMTWEE